MRTFYSALRLIYMSVFASRSLCLQLFACVILSVDSYFLSFSFTVSLSFCISVSFRLSVCLVPSCLSLPVSLSVYSSCCLFLSFFLSVSGSVCFNLFSAHRCLSIYHSLPLARASDRHQSSFRYFFVRRPLRIHTAASLGSTTNE